MIKRNMEAQQNKKLEATTSNRKDFACQVVPFIQVTDLEKLMRENALLKRQLRDAHAKQCESDHGIAAAERAIASLRHQLLNSENKVAGLKLKMDMAKEKLRKQQATADPEVITEYVVDLSTQATQTPERDISELSVWLQEAHKALEKCTAKLQAAEDVVKAEQEQENKLRALKNCIIDLSVKLQQEELNLLKKSFKDVPCTSQKSPSAQCEEIEKVAVKLQKLQRELMKQALSLNTGGKQKKAPNQHEWYRKHRDQEQQTERLEKTAEKQEPKQQLSEDHPDLKEEAANNKKNKNIQQQQLLNKLTTEEALRLKSEAQALELELELSQKDLTVQEALTKTGDLETKLLSMEEELVKTQASYEGRLKHQQKVNDEVSLAQKKAEELLQSRQREWQSERTFLQKAVELLQQTMEEKQRKWCEKESEMSSRIDKLEQSMTEMSENKPKDKKCSFPRLFRHFGFE